MVFYASMSPENKTLENPAPLEQRSVKDPSVVLGVILQKEKGTVDTTKRIEQGNVVIAEIREEIGLAPENVKKSLEKGIVLSPLLLKEKLLDRLEPILKSIGISAHGDLWTKTTEEITNRYTSLKDFSNEAGDFFMELIPQGINKPDVAGQSRHNFTWNALLRKELNAFIPNYRHQGNQLNRKVLRDNLDKFFEESLFRKDKMSYEGELREEDHDGVINQEISRAMNQQGSENIIYERIENNIMSSNGVRYTEANLVIQDIKSGVSLDIDALLPKDFHFTPGLKDLDLKIYGGASVSEGEFYESPTQKVVAYGNITEKGNMLSLFHEIAHSWQTNYSAEIEKGKYAYTTLLEESLRLMEELEEAGLRLESTTTEKDRKIELEKIRKIFEDLSSIGTETIVEGDKILIAEPTPVDKEGVINLQSFSNTMPPERLDSWDIPHERKEYLKKKRYYPIKNSRLEDAMENYIAEERDAWAHALRMMRFLRRRGLDIEPEFKKLADIKEHIDPCLGSYQKGLEWRIKLAPGDYRFSRLPQE